VLVDSGAFLNASNDAAFTGIQNATSWNFRTVAIEDSVRPEHTVRLPADGASSVAITTAISIAFNEPVFVTSGNITLRSLDDTRIIPVTSIGVTGSGNADHR